MVDYLRGTGLCEVAVGVDKNVVYDVEDTVFDENVRAHDLSTVATLVLNKET